MVTTTEIARERLSSSNCSFSDWVPGTLAKKTLRCLLSPIFLFFVLVCLFICLLLFFLPPARNKFQHTYQYGSPQEMRLKSSILAPSLPLPFQHMYPIRVCAAVKGLVLSEIKQTDKQTNKQTDKQTNKQTSEQTSKNRTLEFV